MKWGIIGALDAEIALICDKMEGIRRHERFGSTIYEGKFFGVDVVLACCSIGKVNAACCATTLMVNFTPTGWSMSALPVQFIGSSHCLMSSSHRRLSTMTSNSGLYKKYYPFATSFAADQDLIRCARLLQRPA
jgi:adenosylhomocysteine nucleosidase